jgi:allantoin racemase
MSSAIRRIAVINPNTTQSMTDGVLAAAWSAAQSTTHLIGITARTGVASVESHIDEVTAANSVLTEVERAEASPQPPDAYVIACFGDTGLPAAREAAHGPVVGMTEAALMTATLLAHRFTIITMPRRTMEQSDRVVRTLGLEHRCTVRAIDEPVSTVLAGSSHLFATFVDEARRAMTDDSSEAIILGCAGLADLTVPLGQELGVPIIDGVAAGISLAEGLLAQRLNTSRVSTWARAPQPAPPRFS